ncbi:PGPGW domain-containing protein [Marinactinospora rubrisoli]|uniref:PGPGW domain-containing protein n=1 Tax=Marinactinospora rubrisoli TaxID=2715399 RepID=A0ABW2KJV2_9ACTN
MSSSPVAGTGRPTTAATSGRTRSRRWRRLRARMRVWRMRMHSHPVLHWTWRSVVTVVGGTLLIAGVIMCVTPGPGVGAIILGLAILATEFAWARGLLHRARVRARQAKDTAVQAAATRRRRRGARRGLRSSS